MAAAKILVVEDERITGEDIKMGLESAGYIVPSLFLRVKRHYRRLRIPPGLGSHGHKA